MMFLKKLVSYSNNMMLIIGVNFTIQLSLAMHIGVGTSSKMETSIVPRLKHFEIFLITLTATSSDVFIF